MRRLFHCAANLAQMFHVGSRADVHVQARDSEIVARGALDAFFELRMPNAVLRTIAARICFLTVAMAETGIDSEGDLAC